MKIGIIGTGYVGIVSAVGLAELGHEVVGTDVVPEKIEKASQGIAPIYEPGLEEMLKSNLERGNLSFSPDLVRTILSSDVLFVCVNTPQREDGSANMSYVQIQNVLGGSEAGSVTGRLGCAESTAKPTLRFRCFVLWSGT